MDEDREYKLVTLIKNIEVVEQGVDMMVAELASKDAEIKRYKKALELAVDWIHNGQIMDKTQTTIEYFLKKAQEV